MTLRPVISSSGSFLAIFSVWLDYKMKDLPLVKSYIKNSTSLIRDLKSIQIPQEALLFTANTTCMYTNIDMATGILAIRNFIEMSLHSLPQNFPTDLFLYILSMVMENNIFTFAGTYWLQLAGTAMVTPVACSYATVSFGQHENTVISPTFEPYLIYYKCYINDVFGIWINTNQNSSKTWTAFKNSLNKWGSLRWKIQELSEETVFLDLNIKIKGSSIET
jgi:hypothetical protein